MEQASDTPRTRQHKSQEAIRLYLAVDPSSGEERNVLGECDDIVFMVLGERRHSHAVMAYPKSLRAFHSQSREDGGGERVACDAVAVAECWRHLLELAEHVVVIECQLADMAVVSGMNRKNHWRFEPLKLLLSFDMDCASKQWGADGVDVLAGSRKLGEAVLRQNTEYDMPSCSLRLKGCEFHHCQHFRCLIKVEAKR